MTWRSESAGLVDPPVAALPVRLLNRESGGAKVVSRLEFHSMEQAVLNVTATVEADSKPEAIEFQLKEEMAALDGRLQSQTQQTSEWIEAARSEARIEARRDWERELKEKIVEERECVLRTCERFDQERTRYFAGVEAEVVKLALSIAARVLHREVKLDPLLLTAAVRIALEKVEKDSAKTLRVPMAEVELWRAIFSDAEASEFSVRVVKDERLQAGECVLETNVGRVELGVIAQLGEIERGFFDLLQQRPA